MSEKYKVANPNGIYFITLTIVDWVDVFTRPIYKHTLIDSLTYCQKNKGLVIYAYVIMTSHLHLIVSRSGNVELAEIIRDLKKFTAKMLIKLIQEHPESRREWLLNKFSYAAKRTQRGTNFKVWQDGFHPIELDNTKILEEKIRYIHDNPVEEEIVYAAIDYKYSSARDYKGEKGLLNVELV